MSPFVANAFQGFVREVLDIADILARARGVVPPALVAERAVEDDGVSKEALVTNLRGLLEGVQATEAMLQQVGHPASEKL